MTDALPNFAPDSGNKLSIMASRVADGIYESVKQISFDGHIKADSAVARHAANIGIRQ
jgi:hypothetical protein